MGVKKIRQVRARYAANSDIPARRHSGRSVCVTRCRWKCAVPWGLAAVATATAAPTHPVRKRARQRLPVRFIIGHAVCMHRRLTPVRDLDALTDEQRRFLGAVAVRIPKLFEAIEAGGSSARFKLGTRRLEDGRRVELELVGRVPERKWEGIAEDLGSKAAALGGGRRRVSGRSWGRAAYAALSGLNRNAVSIVACAHDGICTARGAAMFEAIRVECALGKPHAGQD